jgi:hypothetical protein
MRKFFVIFTFAIFGFFVLIISKKIIEGVKISLLPEIELKYENNISLTYPEVIKAYQLLDRKHKSARLFEYGTTDFGYPLHLFVISKTKEFNPERLREKGFRIVLVSNGIHPGEPCGIDASIKLASDILSGKDDLWQFMDSTVICIVPVYNVDGAHNRSEYNRANQNGPIEQGFRANARNLDLNRDYAPMDSRNAQTFAHIFHLWKPHLLIDTHTTNGADYQYIMTLIPTHPQELPPSLGEYYDKVFEPFLYNEMEKSGYDMVPYVSPMGQTPESGLQQYINTPRYTTGYGKSFNTITLMTEAHMFKTFSERVLSTYEFIKASLNFMHTNGSVIRQLKNDADLFIASKTDFVLHWELDITKPDTIDFKGFEAEFIDSKITGGKRLRYDRDKPFTKRIPYFRHYLPKLTITRPDYYIIPQAWHDVIYRLSINDVQMTRFETDTVIEVEAYYIVNYKTNNQPYNGHYLHYDVEVRKENQQIQFYKGDYVIPVNQKVNQYIVEMLEPQAYDSYFAWNFFDPILQRKEYFSPYVFEDFAFEMLEKDEDLREEFESKKLADNAFASNARAQLNFLYERSPYFEKSYMRYPIFRLTSK